MTNQLINWNFPGHYDLFWVIIGLVLFSMVFGYFVWIYLKFSKKRSDSIAQKTKAYDNKKAWGFS